MKKADGVLDRVRSAPGWQRVLIGVVALAVAIPLGTGGANRNVGLEVVLTVLITLAVTALGYLVVLVASYVEDAMDRRRGL